MMKENKTPNKKLYNFFLENLQISLMERQITQPNLPHHVSNLLVKFTNANYLKSIKSGIISNYKSKNNVNDDYLDILDKLKHIYIDDMERSYLADINGFNAKQIFFGHKLIGDYALFMSGMFADFLENGKSPYFNKEYFIRKGSVHYSHASYLLEPAEHNYENNVFEILSEKFSDIAKMLSDLNNANWNIDKVKENMILDNFKKLLN